MKFIRAIAAAGLFVLLLPLVPASAAPTTRAVTIPGNYFSPQTIHIHVGDTVRWTNESGTNHTVTSNSDSAESFNSSTNCKSALLFNDCIKRGRSYAHTFQSRGVFVYRCQIHGADAAYPDCGMCGRVVVVKKSSPTIQPTTPGTSPTSTASGSPSGSPSGSLSPTPGGVSPDSSPGAAGPGESSHAAPTIAFAALGVALLGGAGFVVYRTMIRR
jgi:plastocyanin